MGVNNIIIREMKPVSELNNAQNPNYVNIKIFTDFYNIDCNKDNNISINYKNNIINIVFEPSNQCYEHLTIAQDGCIYTTKHCLYKKRICE